MSDWGDLGDIGSPHNTSERRVDVSGVPYTWGWSTSPHSAEAPADETRRATSGETATHLLQRWSVTPTPPVLGVLLHGGAGLGKTGMACCLVRDAATRAVGESWAWSIVTSPKIVEATLAGDFRRRPAPASFYRWRDLKSLLDRCKTGQTPWDENPPLTAEKVLDEIEDRCRVLALDDVDVDALTPWKEEILLRLLDLPLRGCRVIVTMNANPASPEGITRLGERVVDRLMDPDLFARFYLTGDSIRRRKK